jgi:hypothetical protein
MIKAPSMTSNRPASIQRLSYAEIEALLGQRTDRLNGEAARDPAPAKPFGDWHRVKPARLSS